MVNVMNRYGTVVNHVFEEKVTKAAIEKQFSYDSLTKSILSTMGHKVPKDTWTKMCGPEINSVASVTLRQIFDVIGNVDEASMLPTTPGGSMTRLCGQNSSDSKEDDVQRAAIELARKRVESSIDLKNRENGNELILLHDRCSLQWPRISQGKIERTYISGRLVSTPFRIIFIATSKTIRQRRMSLYMASQFTVSVRTPFIFSLSLSPSPLTPHTHTHTGTLAHYRKHSKRSR